LGKKSCKKGVPPTCLKKKRKEWQQRKSNWKQGKISKKEEGKQTSGKRQICLRKRGAMGGSPGNPEWHTWRTDTKKEGKNCALKKGRNAEHRGLHWSREGRGMKSTSNPRKGGISRAYDVVKMKKGASLMGGKVAPVRDSPEKEREKTNL